MKRRNAPCCKQEYSKFQFRRFIKIPVYFFTIAVTVVTMALIATLPYFPFGDFESFVERFEKCVSLIVALSTGSTNLELLIFYIGKFGFCSVILVALVKTLTKSENPIVLADVAIINGKKNKEKFIFRFWPMKKPGEFISDVEICVYIQDNYYIHLQPRKPIYKWYRNITNSRGILECTFSKEEALIHKKHGSLPDLSDLIFNSGGRYSLIVVVRGRDSSSSYQILKNYNASNIVRNARFAKTVVHLGKGAKDLYKYHLFHNVVVFNPSASLAPSVAPYVITTKDEKEKDRLTRRVHNKLLQKTLNPEKKRHEWSPTPPAA